MQNDKPIIGVDGNEANHSMRVGVNTYAYEVLKNIYKLEDEWSSHAQIKIYLKHEPLPHMPKPTKDFSYEVLHGGGQWILKTLTPYLFTTQAKPKVFWTPSHYIPPFAPMPRICSVMDLGYLEFSKQFKKYDFWQLKLWTAWSIKKSEKVIAISETTRKDIINRYPSARERVITTLLGYDSDVYPIKVSKKESNRVLGKYSMGSSYILFMSTLKPSKNIEGLLKAWSEIEKENPQTQLVVAGKKGWLFESIFDETKRLGLTERVVFTDFVAEEDKPILIANAKAFLLPSFWEGFGLDVLSSMACGIPAIVSDRGSLPEVVSDAGFIVNPDDPHEIAKAIAKVLSATPAEYKKMSERAQKRAKTFSWEHTARKTIEVLLSFI